MNILVLRLVDNDNIEHEREYEKEADLIKAKNWLIKNGATNIDIVMRVNSMQT